MSEEAGGTKKSSSKDESRDEIIRKRSFSRARGIDISSFMVDDGSKEESAEVVDEIEVEQDIAMGEIAEIFSKGGEDFARPGAIQKMVQSRLPQKTIASLIWQSMARSDWVLVCLLP